MKITRRLQGLRTLFSKKDFRRLCTSQVFGGLGEWLATLALIALVWDRTRSAFASGIVLALRILPAAIAGSFLAHVVDRFDRRRVLVACTAGRATIYGLLPLVGGVAPVLALALVAELGTITYVAARDATLPRLVPPRYLPAANAVSMASSFAAMPFGSGLFALLAWMQTRFVGPGVALPLLVAAGMLATATVLLGRIDGPACMGGALRLPAEAKPRARAVLRDAMRADPVLRRVLLGGVVIACCAGTLLTLGLAYVRETLHAGPAAYGGLLTAFCFGALVGALSVHGLRSHLPRVFHVGGGVMGAILLGMAVFPSTAMGFAMSFIFGGAAVATFLGGITILQDRVDDAVRGRAFAVAHSTLRVGAVAVGLAAAWAAKRLGASHVLWTMDGTQVMLAIAGLGLLASGMFLLTPPKRARVPA